MSNAEKNAVRAELLSRRAAYEDMKETDAVRAHIRDINRELASLDEGLFEADSQIVLSRPIEELMKELKGID